MLKHIPFYSSLLDRTLNGKKPKHSHVLVYGAIEVHAMGPKGCIVSNSTLGKETGFTADTISNMISELAKGGWIEIIQGANAKRRAGLMPLGSVTMPLDNGTMPLPNGIHYIETEEKTVRENQGDINSMITYFYSKLIPAETSSKRFIKTNQDSMEALLKTYGLADVRDTIDKAKELIGKPYKPQVQSITALIAKYEQVRAEKQIIKHQATTHL